MIKRINKDDLKNCLDIIHRSFLTVAEQFGLTPENCPTNGAFMPYSRLLSDFENGAFMFGIYQNDILAGFMQLKNKGNGIFELEKLAVLPEFRHLGLGARLLNFACEEVKSFGGKKITIGIIEENVQLKNWYISQGFAANGTKKFTHLPF